MLWLKGNKHINVAHLRHAAMLIDVDKQNDALDYLLSLGIDRLSDLKHKPITVRRAVLNKFKELKS